MSRTLDDRARKLAEDNINLCHSYVTYYAKNQQSVLVHFGWTLDDLKSMAYVGLCKAARDFDPNKGYKFSTLAYIAFYHEITREVNRLNKLKRRGDCDTISITAPVPDTRGLILADVIESDEPLPEEICINNERISVLRKAMQKILSERDRKALCMFYSGYRQIDIARQIGCSQGGVSRIVRSACDRLKRYMATMYYVA